MWSKPKIYLAITFVGCCITFAAMFLPWWRAIEYTNTMEVYASQSVHLLPPEYLIESSFLVVNRNLPLGNPLFLLLPIILLIIANLGLYSTIIIYAQQQLRRGSRWLLVSALGLGFALVLFTFLLRNEIQPWFTTIAAPPEQHILPYDRVTSWSVSSGFLMTGVATAIFLTSALLWRHQAREPKRTEGP